MLNRRWGELHLDRCEGCSDWKSVTELVSLNQRIFTTPACMYRSVKGRDTSRFRPHDTPRHYTDLGHSSQTPACTFPCGRELRTLDAQTTQTSPPFLRLHVHLDTNKTVNDAMSLMTGSIFVTNGMDCQGKHRASLVTRLVPRASMLDLESSTTAKPVHSTFCSRHQRQIF